MLLLISDIYVITAHWTEQLWNDEVRYLIVDFKSWKCSTVYRRRVEDNLLHTTFTQCYVYIIPLSYKLALIFVPEHANSYPHRGTREGGGNSGWKPPSKSFLYVALFRNDFPFSGKPLIFSTRWGIFGAAGGLWRRQQRSPSWPPSWILPRIKNQVKTSINGDCLCLTWKITHI